MKKTIRTYIYTILLFLIPFIFVSFILAILSYFIQLNSLTMNIFIQAISYILLIISALYFTSQIKQKRTLHCLLLALIYFLISLFMHLGNLHLVHLFLKPFIFILVGLFKDIRDHQR